ncbi:MAG: acyl--CoA ligase [Lachnospiraceae bacterium]|nr:acyl--CoA ligase [Lachnospiraceae bacterium]
MLNDWASRTPDAHALYYDADGKRSVTYRRLLETVEARAEKLQEQGNTCLGVLADGSFSCIVDVFAAVFAGMQVVMLDASLSEKTLSQLIRQTDVDQLSGSPALCLALKDSLTKGVSGGSGNILFFTSGTTEQSKAVVLTEGSLCSSAWNGSEMLPLQPGDLLLCILPLNHVFGFVCGLLWGLQCGATVALGRGPRHYFDDWMFYMPTAASVVPTMAEFLLRVKGFNPELRQILIGAGDCSAEVLTALQQSGLKVAFGYGLTETSSGVAISTQGDPRAMSLCPDCRISLAPDGEILIFCPLCMMQGYYKRPEDTRAVLCGGVLSTGDLGRFDEEGRLYITGRKKDVLVLSNGTKIFLPEFEEELSQALGEADLAVTAENDRLTLILCTEQDEQVIKAKLRPWALQKPLGQQITRIVRRTTPLPRTATGKLIRWKLL